MVRVEIPFGDDFPVGYRAEAGPAEPACKGSSPGQSHIPVVLGSGLIGQGEILPPGHVLEFFHVFPGLCIDSPADFLGDGLVHCGGGVSAEGDCLAYETRTGGHRKDGTHLGAAAGLSHDCHVGGVPAEGGDIVMDPPQCLHEVKNPRIAGSLEPGVDG